jgi:hypothetical protein
MHPRAIKTSYIKVRPKFINMDLTASGLLLDPVGGQFFKDHL